MSFWNFIKRRPKIDSEYDFTSRHIPTYSSDDLDKALYCISNDKEFYDMHLEALTKLAEKWRTWAISQGVEPNHLVVNVQKESELSRVFIVIDSTSVRERILEVYLGSSANYNKYLLQYVKSIKEYLDDRKTI